MRFIKLIIVLIAITLVALIYWRFNPIENELFPKCPFLVTTGLKCPGCGSQRAIHHLLNLEFRQAFTQNMMLVVSIPYIITGAFFDSLKQLTPTMVKWRKLLFGQQAIIIILILIISFWILRNIF